MSGNVLRDYLTDLFPILELGTSAKERSQWKDYLIIEKKKKKKMLSFPKMSILLLDLFIVEFA